MTLYPNNTSFNLDTRKTSFLCLCSLHTYEHIKLPSSPKQARRRKSRRQAENIEFLFNRRERAARKAEKGKQVPRKDLQWSFPGRKVGRSPSPHRSGSVEGTPKGRTLKSPCISILFAFHVLFWLRLTVPLKWCSSFRARISVELQATRSIQWE